MDIKKLQSIVVDALEDIKAQEIVVFDTTGLTSLFDRIAIASGTSNRQTKRKSTSEGKAAVEKEATPKKSGHLAASKPAKPAEAVIEKKPAAKKPGTAKATAAAGAVAKKAAARKAAPKVVAPEGKKVKVATTKTAEANVKAAKEKKAAAAAAAPAKTVIKRIKKPAAE
jgi:ribosome-associated protein